MIIHQSGLNQLGRCAAAFGYELAGVPTRTNSAAVFGTVMHDALHWLERERSLGRPFEECVTGATQRFTHYWSPLNIEGLTEPVPADGWLPRQGYAELRARGISAIQSYADLIRFDDHQLLGIEYSFMVPIDGTWDDDLGEPHILAGSVDRLAIRHYKRVQYLAIDDWKTGKDYVHLRQNLQFTAYAYASTRPEFWTGWRHEEGFGPDRGMAMFEQMQDWGRKGTWINLRKFAFQDAGWRGPIDYGRFKLAVEQMYAMVKADAFPLTITGEVCRYCDFRAMCGGTGIAPEEHGKPEGVR